MLRPAMIALACLAAAPAAMATPHTPRAGEVTIPRMSHYLEWREDSPSTLYIRGDTGRWYLVRTQAPCPRLLQQPRIRFQASPSDRFDRFSSIRADGWRCLVSSITESGPPPAHARSHLASAR